MTPTIVPNTSEVVLLSQSTAPHSCNVKTSSNPVWDTSESKNGSTVESGYTQQEYIDKLQALTYTFYSHLYYIFKAIEKHLTLIKKDIKVTS